MAEIVYGRMRTVYTTRQRDDLQLLTMTPNTQRISVAKYLQVCIVFQHTLTKWLATPTVYLSQLEVCVRATCRPGLGV